MKKIFLFFLFLSIFQFGFAQEESKNLTVKEVTKMAVFPGCESFTEKTDLIKCLSNNLSSQLGGKLSDFVDEMQRNNVASAVARIQFVISKDGKIIQIQALNGSDEKLGEASVNAFNQIAEQTSKIEPAMIEGEIPVNMIFQIPVNFKLEISEIVEPVVENTVLFTLVDKDVRYEIRLIQNKSLKAYELKNGQYTFLGNYPNINELGKAEPYFSLMQHDYLAKKSLLTEGNVEGQNVKIYIHNLLNVQIDSPIYLEVINEAGQTITKFHKDSDFAQSPYASLIKRD